MAFASHFKDCDNEVSIEERVPEAPKKLPPILDNQHFRFVRTGAVKNGVTQIFATCLLCKGGKQITGDSKSTGNFLKHLQTSHPIQHSEYLKRKLEGSALEDRSQKSMKRFCQVVSVTSGLKIKVEQLTTDYIVHSMKPLSTADDPWFRRLIRGAAQNPQLPLLNRKSLAVQINQKYKEVIESTASKFKGLEYLCLTADCWSSHARAFLGVTAHWIDKDFKRESAVLACTRFTGTHSYDRIAEHLNIVMTKYSIKTEQVVAIVTDNGSNFCKAFKEFGIEFMEKRPGHSLESELEEGTSCLEADSDEDEIFTDNVQEILENGNKSTYTLPPHFRCTSHTLSLVATKDGMNVKDKRLYNSALGKCTKLWNLSSSPKSFEKIKNACGISLKRPAPTRWNSLYDSLECLLRVEANFDRLFEELNIASFQVREIEFLKEFLQISKPVAIALDKLQGEYGVFMGSLLPTLVRVKALLIGMQEKTVHCKNFLAAYIAGIDKRFGELMKIDVTNPSDYVFASLTNPLFKFRWIQQELHDALKQRFILRATEFATTSNSTNNSAPNDDIDPFYSFEELDAAQSTSVSHSKSNVELECVRYFNDTSNTLSMLIQYPTIQKMFRRYNTSLPSSAPVERVFSYAGLILSSRRTSLTDGNFEKLVLLKCNTILRADLE